MTTMVPIDPVVNPRARGQAGSPQARSPWNWIRRHRGLLVAFAACGVLFFLLPAVDLAVSGWFTDASGRFVLQHDPVLRTINDAITWASRALAALLLAAALLAALARWAALRAKLAGFAWLYRRQREIYFLTAALVLGPGLLVNGVLKEYWGRARPVAVRQFGGEQTFSRAFVIADQCETNCAFVSGHAAVSTYPVVGYFLARRRRTRRAFLVGGLGLGLGVGLGRIAAGAHYLSDVVIGVFLVYLVAAACAAWLLRRAAHAQPRTR